MKARGTEEPAIRAVVFDLDDTLYPEWQFVVGGFRAAARFLGPLTGLPEKNLLLRMLELFNSDKATVFERLVAEIGEWSNSEWRSADIVRELLSCYRRHRPRLRLFPDAAKVLPELRWRGLLLGLVTDGDADIQRSKVRALGLDALFDAVVYTDELAPDRRHWKPSPCGFTQVARLLGVDPPQAVYVGDNPAKDFAGAAAIGMRIVWIRRRAGLHSACPLLPGVHPDRSMATLEELLPMLEQ